MRRQEYPQGYYSYPALAGFPASGREGFKYRDESTGAMYICISGAYEPYSGTGSGTGGGLPGGGNEGEYLTRGENEREGAWVPFPFDGAEIDMIKAYLTGRPARPQNISPVDDGIDVYQVPSFTGTRYESPVNEPMDGMTLRIAADGAVDADGMLLAANAVFEEYFIQADTTVNPDDFWASIIQASTGYHWQIRYADAIGRWSRWSIPTKFTTEAVFTAPVIVTPEILYPKEAGLVPPVNPFVASSAFQVRGGSGVHASTDWQAALDDAFVSVVHDAVDDTANLTTKELPIAMMSNVRVRARYKEGNSGVKSSWSLPRLIRPRPLYTDSLIGVGFRVSYGDALIGHRIDGQGNDVAIPSDYFQTHPIYNFSMDTIAGNDMAGVLPVYVRAESDNDAPVGQDRYRFWISPYEFDDSYLHPAFALSNGKIWLARTLDNGSSGNASRSLLTGGNAKNYSLQNNGANVAYLNTGADSEHQGWFIETCFDYFLKYLLMIIEYASFKVDDKFTWGKASSLEEPVTAAIPWHGIHKPFSNGTTGVLGMSMLVQCNANPATGDVAFPYNQFFLGTVADVYNLTDVTSLLGLPATGQYNKTDFIMSKILTGFKDELGYDIELLFRVKDFSAGTSGSGARLYVSNTYAAYTFALNNNQSNPMSMWYGGNNPANDNFGEKRIVKRF